ncbi:hypothetical protein PRZ48_004469 [Zasmidium cellare]|uniref:Ubiquitin-like modifier HUB1 n=1 Tax=Zasmidium cellare TaxID=395010 RepID=A0ABR0EPN2_ZASCE|nr:hypothetical protein PRZ48_004469 [Zasmidium cellare]
MTSDDERSRSASPAREPKPKKSKTSGGFRWKEKRPRDEEPDSRSGGRLERGYRDRSPRRDTYKDSREDKREEDRPRRRDNHDRDRDEDRSSKRRDVADYDSYQPNKSTTTSARDEDRSSKRGDAAGSYDSYQPNNNTTTSSRDEEIRRKFGDIPTSTTKDTSTPTSTDPKPAKKDKKDKKDKPKKQLTTNEPMIIVNVNDRLGTKAAIPCLASDSVKAFKAMVAAHIGRQPHEIMIKRQGERPFKDQLSLEDYGVSSGVQLDLELDTGD